MYVGEPKKTQTLYVREKVMSQEVTFTELHNYLMRVCGNDYTITLHYTLNNQYVSITTTGQLQTFLEYVRQIPTMLLYVENKDYVWNLDGKSKSGKKKHCNGATQEARSSTSSSENSEESSETGSSEADVEVNVDECRQCICCKCALDSPNDDAEVPAEGATLEGDSSCDECFSPTHSESDSLEHIKADMLEDDDEYLSLSDNEADAASQCSIGSGNKTFDYSSLSSNESYATYKLFKKPVKTNKELLKEKSASELRVMCDCLDSCRQCYSNNKIWVKFKEIIQEKLENQYYNIIKEDFLIKNECDPDMIEDGMYTFLNKLAQDTITQLWEIHSKHAPTTPVPKKEDPQPSEGAKLKIKSGPVETTHEECPNDACRSYNDVIDVIYFYAKKIRAMNLIVKRKPLWRSFVDDMKKLRDLDVGTLLPESNLSDLRGLIETSVKTVEKLCVVLETDWKEETELCHCDTNFIVKATKLMNTLSASPFDSSGDSEWSSAECSKWKKNVRQSIDALQNSYCDVHNVWNIFEDMERRRAKKIKPSTSVTATNTTAECCDSPNSSSSGCSSQKSGPIVLPEKIKNELDELVKKQHNYVYPALPKAGAIMIPIGGLARCRCKKDCKFELNEPAYAYIERFNEPRLAIWEKTRQKRIKKN